MSIRTIDLHDRSSVLRLTDDLDTLDRKMGRSIVEAVEILSHYKETTDLSPEQIQAIFQNLQITDTYTPAQMNDKLVMNDKTYILNKKFFDDHVSKKEFESILASIIFTLAENVSGDVLHAIINLVKNFSFVCLHSQDMNIKYKEVCFKFYCRDVAHDQILILLINLDYGMKEKQRSLFWRLLNFASSSLHLSFFGAVVRTTL